MMGKNKANKITDTMPDRAADITAKAGTSANAEEKTGNKSVSRYRWLDAARGFAIIFVMIGHCITKGTFFHKFIFTFHVPMFFVIAGYLYRNKEGSWKKDLKQLFIPYAAVVLIVAIFGKMIEGGGYYGNTSNLIKSALFGAGVDHDEIKLIGSIWFWPTIFLARRYLDCIFSWFEKDWARAIGVMVLVLMGVGFSKEKIWTPMNADVALVAVLFMFTGYLMHLGKLKMTPPVAIASVAFWVMSLYCERINIGKRDYEIW
ncbi:MAG: acyltransferase family protein, partial [Lachnospiraceae bacterium]|nr:acyltransferase family protein [Lachnospiraceae bacterium]